MPTITLTSNGRGYSFSCSDGGGGATASTSSILYLGGNLYCTFIPFANVCTALGSTAAGTVNIKKATLKLYGVEPYNSSTGNSSTNNMRIGVGTQGSSVVEDCLVQKNTNIYGSSSVWGPVAANCYFSSTLQKVTLTDTELDYTEQIKAMLNNKNTAGGTLNFHTASGTYLWICADSITGQSKTNCLRASTASDSRAQLIIEFTESAVYTGGSWKDASSYVYTSIGRTQYTYPAGAMNAATSQNCTASASSTYSSGYPAWRCFDNSTSTAAWASSESATGPWVKLKMPAKLYDITVTITNRADRNDNIRGPIAGYIEGSTDDSTWDIIYTFSGRNGSTKGASTTYTCTNTSKAYNYVRVRMTDWYPSGASNNTYCAIGEIDIKGYNYPTTAVWKPAVAYIYTNGAWKQMK